MLILTRKLGEKIVIGNTTTVPVLSNSNGVVRLRIVATKEVLVLREELIEPPPAKPIPL